MWRRTRFPSLSRRIVVSVAVGLGLIQVLFGLLALWTIRESTEAAYRERISLAQVHAQHVDGVLRYTLMTLERDASTLRIEPGRLLSTEQRDSLVGLRARVGSLSILSVIDAGGSAVWTDPGRSESLVGYLLKHPSAQLALDTGRSQISEFTSPLDPATVFACLAIPLHDRSGRVAGVLLAAFDPSHPAASLLPSQGTDGDMHAELISAAGQLVAGPQGANLAMALDHHDLLADLRVAQSAGYRIHDPGPQDQFPSHLVAYAPVFSLPSWGVVVEQPQDTVLAVPHRLQQRLTGFGLLALLLAAAVAWFDTRRIVRPLKELTMTAERFAAGQLDQPVQIKRGDEVGVLAKAFETMRQRLRVTLAEVEEWNHELERRVAARTAEVEARNRERAQLLQMCIASQEDERRRLAQELHDETSQALASLQIGLERLAAGSEHRESAQHLAAQLQSVAAQTLVAVHQLAVQLRPSVLDDAGLVAALERYLREYGRRWNLAVDFAVVGTSCVRLLPAAETAVYRIVQAALTNVVQHADARHVSVLLQRRDRKLVVVVEDDGRGFDLAAVRAAPLETRLGLAGMEERAFLIGATLTIETSPDAGTTAFLEVPLDLNGQGAEADVKVADPTGG